MIRDRIVFGTSWSQVREKLANEGASLTLDKAIQIAQNLEYAKQKMSSIAGPEEKELHRVSRRDRIDRRGRKPRAGDDTRGQSRCPGCGNKYNEQKLCPAKGKKKFQVQKTEPFRKNVQIK